MLSAAALRCMAVKCKLVLSSTARRYASELFRWASRMPGKIRNQRHGERRLPVRRHRSDVRFASVRCPVPQERDRDRNGGDAVGDRDHASHQGRTSQDEQVRPGLNQTPRPAIRPTRLLASCDIGRHGQHHDLASLRVADRSA